MKSALLTALVLCNVVSSAQAQFSLRDLLPPSLRGSESGTNRPAPETDALPAGVTRGLTSATIAGGAPPAGRKKDITAELTADRECKRPQERFNVAEKVLEYGGTEAALRLERLVNTNYRFADLTPQDHEMLKYLAQTTMWVPAEVETRLGDVFARVSGSGAANLDELDRAGLDEVDKRLDRLRATVSDFPATIKLVVNPDLPTGALAKFGGVIQLSPPFLQTMTANSEGGDFILAHELSHVYKRHSVKQMQFQLLSTREGWELAQKLLQRSLRAATFEPIKDGLFLVMTLPKLVSFVREMQSKYTREQELEADACSAMWLGAAGIDPARAWGEFRKSAAAQPSQQAGYYDSHPPTEEREANFTKKVGAKATSAAKPPPSGRDASRSRSTKRD